MILQPKPDFFFHCYFKIYMLFLYNFIIKGDNMKKFINEFKEFAFKGNVLNLAVGIIIGAAFQTLVTSFTNDILSPIIGLFAGQNFNAWQINVFDVEIKYGAFITSIINFLMMALVVFIIVKSVNKITSIHKPPEKPNTHKCPFCTTEIDIKAIRCPACTSHLTESPE